MRGGVQLIVALCGMGIVCAMRCDRTPDGVVSHKSTPDGRFSLSISGNPEKYVPGTSYTVSINGTRSTHMPPKFIGFSLIVESTNPFRVRDGGETEIPPVGSLQLFADALVKHSEKCPNMVTQTSSLPKNEIQIRWTAPPSGNGCIVFKATVVEHRDVWFQDDGPLTKTLCEDVQENLDMQPEALKECCACNEAKYEVAFEGMWSRHTHPKDFPSNSWLTRFSDVIGASHTTDYRFWEYGGIASEGLRNVAERGSTRMLESELKDHSQDIRTIIKARGISYPNVTAKTFAVFRVDRKHHLMSLVSMIDPSPDWIVGVSGLELCLKNCSWIESKVLNLYPWDAGTDSGVTYISPDIPTDPRDNIRRITSSFPNDPQSPFYDTAGEEMKPLARLHLTRQRIYPQKCEDTTDATRPVPLVCSVGAWGEWSECSATCGQGNRKKQRFYLYPDLADQYNCKKKLTQREPCYSALSCGPAEPVEPTEDPMCALTDWSDWSRCSVSCGQGVRLRYRTLKSKSAWKYCSPKGLRTQQTDICSSYSAVCGPSYKIFETLPEEEAKEKPSLCEMTNWSEWSPCNATCASIYGIRVRIRTLLLYKGMPAMAASSYGNRDEDDNETEGEKEKGDEDVDEMYPDRENKEEPCPELPRRLEMPCNVSAECIYTPEKAKEICQMPREEGSCRSRLRKFYFDTTDQECKKFVYSGCRGNDNRFDSLEECESVCATVKETTEVDNTSSTTTADPSMRGESLVNATDVTEVTERPVVDCKMSKWSKWTQCSATCGKGFKKKFRNIVMNAQNGGKACPKKTIKKRRCHVRCPDHSGRSGKKHKKDDDDHSGRSGKKHKKDDDDCVYSEWSTWSQCTVSCGPTSVQQRSRNVDYGQTAIGAQCENRFEVRACYVLPCKDT